MAETNCGCKVELEFTWDHLDVIGDKIIYCALHATAPELLQALRTLTFACIPSVASRYGTRMPKREEVDAALEAIRKAGGE